MQQKQSYSIMTTTVQFKGHHIQALLICKIMCNVDVEVLHFNDADLLINFTAKSYCHYTCKLTYC